jgi:flagellar motility protein MotE (MotC chaperone)
VNRIRLLPLVLIAVTALLAVKVLGFVMGVEPFAVGPQPAIASGGEAEGHGEVAADPSATADTSAVDRLTAPIDLAGEYKKLKAEQEKDAAGHGGGHGEAPAEGHGEAPPADAHGDPAAAETPAADGHGDAPATDAAHDNAPATDAAHGDAPATDAAHGDAPATDAAHDEAPATSGGDAAAPAEEKPAADAHGEAKPADGGHGGDAHGAKGKSDVYTERPKEYSPPIGSSERAILEGLATRRDDLDKRAHDLDLRAKLLEAAEKRLTDRLNQLQSIETQLGGGTADAPAASSAPGAAPAGGQAAGSGQAAAMDDKLAALVSLYESMKPKAAAAVFDKLDGGTLLELAEHMNPRKLSPIVAAMDPDKASRITNMMIGAREARKRVVVQVEQTTPVADPTPSPDETAPTDASQLPQIMPAPSGH